MGFFSYLNDLNLVYPRIPEYEEGKRRSFFERLTETQSLIVKYNHLEEILLEIEGEFVPSFSDRFWMKYHVHCKVVNREELKKGCLLEENVDGNRESLIKYINMRVGSFIKEHYADFPYYPESSRPIFYKMKNYSEYMVGKAEKLKLAEVFINDFWNNVVNKIDIDHYGLKVWMAIDKEFCKGGKMKKEEVLIPEVVDDDFKEIEAYLVAKSKGESVCVNLEELEKIKNRFGGQFRFKSKIENEKLNMFLKHLSGIIEYEKSKSRLENIELEKRLDITRNLVEFKKLHVEFLELKKQEKELSQDIPKEVIVKKPMEFKDLDEEIIKLKNWCEEKKANLKKEGFAEDSEEMEVVENVYQSRVMRIKERF